MPKKTLGKIAAEKRERILREAGLIFAERGYSQTDMDALAKRCGIAKGSLYNYFKNKEELYLFVCRDGLERSRIAVWSQAQQDWDIYQLVDHIFRRGVAFAQEYPQYVSLYLNISSAGMERFAAELSLEVERTTSEQLKRTLRSGVAAGTVRNVDVNHAAWLINNTYVMLLAALVSSHYKIRMQEYLDIDGELGDSDIVAQMERTIQLVQQMLRPQGRG